MPSNKVYLIIGGTGSLGQYVVDQLGEEPAKIIVYSRDEYKQVTMRREFPNKNLRFFIGDIRDKERLHRALTGVDYVIHCAALKHVDVGEYNPSEVIKTNVMGAMNLIEASIDAGVNKVLAVSTDKSVNPINLYGAAKLCADKLFVGANVYSGREGTKFSVIRFGNFKGSRGSVISYFESLRDQRSRVIPITDFRMTRFWVSLQDAAVHVTYALQNMQGGEIFAPKMEKRRVCDLAFDIYPQGEQVEVGIRPGEKLHEDLVLPSDAPYTVETRWAFVTYPHHRKPKRGLPDGFTCNSVGDN